MGFLNMAIVNVALYLAFLLHSAFNTPYDWLILGVVMSAAALLVNDEHLKAIFAIVKAYYRSKVDLKSWFAPRVFKSANY